MKELSEWNMLFIKEKEKGKGRFAAVNTVCRAITVKIRAGSTKECNSSEHHPY